MKTQLLLLLACCSAILSQQRRYYLNGGQRYGEWENPYVTSPGSRRYVIGEEMVMDFKDYLLTRNYYNARSFEPFVSSNVDVVHQSSEPAQKQVLNQLLVVVSGS